MSEMIKQKEYVELLSGIKARIQSARIAASRSVNRELILLYWDIGRSIVERQQDEGWGKSVVEQLSKDIQKEFLGVTGYSPANIWRMRQFYTEYTSSEFLAQLVPELKILIHRFRPKQDSTDGLDTFLAQPVREIGYDGKIQILQQLVGAIPWGHNILITEKIKDTQESLYYILASTSFGWSRNVLLNQIKAKAYQRAMLEDKSHNFRAVMPVRKILGTK